jgi:hypothetical protein
MRFSTLVMAILFLCVMSCMGVWIQNVQLQLSYQIRDHESVHAQLIVHNQLLQSELAFLSSPRQLLARLSEENLGRTAYETRWVTVKKKESPIFRSASMASRLWASLFFKHAS